jgi:hypothetical protein
MNFDPSNEHWKQEVRVCPSCPELGTQPLANFYVSTTRPNGRTSYCRICTRAKIAKSRKEKKEYNAVQRAAGIMIETPKTKPIIRSLQSQKYSPAKRVKESIQRGATVQSEIVQATKLPKDKVCDALAHLLLWSREIGSVVVDNERRYFINDGSVKIRREPIRPREPRSHGVSTIYSETSPAELYYSEGRVAKG